MEREAANGLQVLQATERVEANIEIWVIADILDDVGDGKAAKLLAPHAVIGRKHRSKIRGAVERQIAGPLHVVPATTPSENRGLKKGLDLRLFRNRTCIAGAFGRLRAKFRQFQMRID